MSHSRPLPTPPNQIDFNKLPHYYHTTEASDITLVSSDDRGFHVHKVVLEQHLSLQTLREKSPRQETRFIGLNEESDVVDRMLQWMYGVKWPDSPETNNLMAEMIICVGLVDASDKYVIPGLEEDTVDYVKSFIDRFTSVRQSLTALRALLPGGTEDEFGEWLVERAEELIESGESP